MVGIGGLLALASVALAFLAFVAAAHHPTGGQGTFATMIGCAIGFVVGLVLIVVGLVT